MPRKEKLIKDKKEHKSNVNYLLLIYFFSTKLGSSNRRIIRDNKSDFQKNKKE